MKRDDSQLSIFDSCEDYSEIIPSADDEIWAPVATDPKFRSKKPLLTFRVMGVSYHEEAGRTLTVHAVSEKQAKWLYNQKTGNCFTRNMICTQIK